MAQVDDNVEVMRTGMLIDGLDHSVVTRLLEQADLINLEDGQILFRQGEVGNAAYLVVAGSVEVVVETPLGDVCMATLGPQQMVGEIAVFSELMRTATVRAKGETALLCIERSDMAGVIADHPETAFGLIAALGRRIHALNQPLALLTLAAQALEHGEDSDGLLARIANEFLRHRTIRAILSKDRSGNGGQASQTARTGGGDPHSTIHPAQTFKPWGRLGHGRFYETGALGGRRFL